MTEFEHDDVALLRSFIIPERRKRYLGLLASQRGRAKLRRRLAHLHDLDARFARELPSHQHTPAAIAAVLQAKGAPADCWIISEDDRLDGRRLSLEEALAAIVGRGMGTLISCVPGRLGFYEGEEQGMRKILERPFNGRL